MKILLIGATGYIGKRLLPSLIENGHIVVCSVRDAKRFSPQKSLLPYIEIIEGDLLDRSSLDKIPTDIDGAYYLAHSMSSAANYESLELKAASNFREAINRTNIRHVVFLSNMVNEDSSSKHLTSRKDVEAELGKGKYMFTSLRAGIIIGSGSASFEIIRDLVEKLPVMIAPKWLNTRCQPIGVSDVIKFLSKTLFNPNTFNQSFDIGGKDILTYKEMLLGFAKARYLKRRILIMPIKTLKISPYWISLITVSTYELASILVDSLKGEIISHNNKLSEILDIEPITYNEALSRAFSKIESDEIVSSWKDSFISGILNINISDFINVPSFGCLSDTRIKEYSDLEKCIMKIWRIGGNTGWYYGNWLWRLRGVMDKVIGGVGLRRRRTHDDHPVDGDAVDFWRLLYANKEEGRLLLFAEMKLPGEGWLEFRISDNKLIQKATFRPKGLWGRLYWISFLPFHGFIFKGMINELTKG